MTLTEIGRRLGKAMAVGMRGDGLDYPWPGLEVMDPDYGDPLGAAGIERGTLAWREAEAATKEEYRKTMAEVW